MCRRVWTPWLPAQGPCTPRPHAPGAAQVRAPAGMLAHCVQGVARLPRHSKNIIHLDMHSSQCKTSMARPEHQECRILIGKNHVVTSPHPAIKKGACSIKKSRGSWALLPAPRCCPENLVSIDRALHTYHLPLVLFNRYCASDLVQVSLHRFQHCPTSVSVGATIVGPADALVWCHPPCPELGKPSPKP